MVQDGGLTEAKVRDAGRRGRALASGCVALAPHCDEMIQAGGTARRRLARRPLPAAKRRRGDGSATAAAAVGGSVGQMTDR